MFNSKKTHSRKQSKRQAKRSLRTEKLRDRQLLAGDWMPSVTFDGSDILVDGSKFNDQAVVRLHTQGTESRADDRIEVTIKNFIYEDRLEIP